jgi:RNA polymerase sigma-70 factor (ECF subfamily)
MIDSEDGRKEELFPQIVREYRSAIYAHVLRRVGLDHAEDVAQDVMETLYVSARSFERKSKLGTWVFSVTRAVCISHLRRQELSRKWVRTLDPDEDSFADASGPEEQLQQEEQSRDFRRALARLPENQATALILSYMKELDYAQIAAKMNIPITTVPSLFFRARKQLRIFILKE